MHWHVHLHQLTQYKAGQRIKVKSKQIQETKVEDHIKEVYCNVAVKLSGNIT